MTLIAAQDGQEPTETVLGLKEKADFADLLDTFVEDLTTNVPELPEQTNLDLYNPLHLIGGCKNVQKLKNACQGMQKSSTNQQTVQD